MTELLAKHIEKLPESFQRITIFLILLAAFFKTIIIPIASFFSDKVFNKTINNLLKIISNKDLNKLLIIQSSKELSIIYKTILTKSKKRDLALYFYELSNVSNHTISYTHFKRLYKYLSFSKKGILISSNFKCLNILKCITIGACFLDIVTLIYLIYDKSNGELNNCVLLLYLFIIFVLIILCFFIWHSTIKNKEIKEFEHAKDLYNKQVIERLTLEIGNDYFKEE